MKILIRATNWVGDAILALPALRAVRMRFPDAQIAIVARPYVADIYRDQEICNQLMPYDPEGLDAGFFGRERLAAGLRAQKFDVALLLQNAFGAAWLAWRANIPERVGYARDGRSFLLTKAVPVPRHGEIPAHEKYYYLELLRRAGWLDSLLDETFIGLHVPEEKRRSADEFLCNSGMREGALRIAIGAGASYGSAKCWPPSRFAEVAKIDCKRQPVPTSFSLGLPARQTFPRPSPLKCVSLRSISRGKPQLPICPLCSRNAISSSVMIPARCMSPLLLDFQSSRCLVRRIRLVHLLLRSAAAFFNRSLTAVLVFFAVARPITVA